MKFMTIVGTRPEIIRLSLIIAKLDEVCDHVLVHTGQNYDFELNGVFFSELDVRKPDHFLEVDTSSLGATLGGVLQKSEAVMKAERPDAVLILGDTNSAIAALIATRLKIPVYHMEAGNRSFDRNVPEEINRRLIDHIADFNLVYTEHARRHLLSEGLAHRRILVSGSPMKEVLDHYRPGIENSKILAELDLDARGYFIVSMHREENVDSKHRLASLVDTLNHLAERYDMPLIVSTHPRTRNRLENMEGLSLDGRVTYSKPFGFFDYNHLQMNAFCAISDSGTIAEESAILDFPAISPRDALERPEAVEAGSIIGTGLDREVMIAAIDKMTNDFAARRAAGLARNIPADYEIPNCSERVINLMLGTAHLSNAWDGIRVHDYL